MKIVKNIFNYFLITFFWCGLLYCLFWIKRIEPNCNVDIPSSTTNVIQIKPKALITELLPDIYLKNKDIGLINSIHSYLFSGKISTTETLFYFDLNYPIYLVHCKLNKQSTWLLKGKPNGTSFSKKPSKYIYSKKSNDLYAILDGTFSADKREQLKKEIFADPIHLMITNESLSAYSISNGKLKNKYIPQFTDNKISILTSGEKIKKRKILINKPNSFHLSTDFIEKINLPKSITEYDYLTDNLIGFSLNYYGAESNAKTDFLSPVPKFESILSFKKSFLIDSLQNRILVHFGKEAKTYPGKIEFYEQNYYFHQIDSATVYIGSYSYKPTKIELANQSFQMTGEPKYLTQIKNLGLWGTLLNLIPSYSSSDYFFKTIKKIEKENGTNNTTIKISFKPKTIPRIEIIRLFLALNS
jgi:hypothetical protein